MSHSSISSFKDLLHFVLQKKTIWMVLFLSLAIRLAVDPLRDWPRSDVDKEDIKPFLTAEKYIVDEMEESPVVLLMGSSRTQYCFVPEQMAEALGLPETAVLNIAIEAGNPWDALTLLKRNPELFKNLELVIFDAEPWHLNENFEKLLLERFYKMASFEERLRVPGRNRLKAVSSWVWPYQTLRRPLSSWMQSIRSLVTRDDGLNPKSHLPRWRFEADTAKLRQAKLKNPDMRPENFAQRVFKDFSYSRRMENTYRDLIDALRARGVKVFIHQPPSDMGFYDWLEKNPEAGQAYGQYTDFIESLDAVGEDVWVKVWHRPQEAGLKNDDLLDYGHFGREAAQIYTNLVCGLIKEKGILQLVKRSSGDL